MRGIRMSEHVRCHAPEPGFRGCSFQNSHDDCGAQRPFYTFVRHSCLRNLLPENRTSLLEGNIRAEIRRTPAGEINTLRIIDPVTTPKSSVPADTAMLFARFGQKKRAAS